MGYEKNIQLSCDINQNPQKFEKKLKISDWAPLIYYQGEIYNK